MKTPVNTLFYSIFLPCFIYLFIYFSKHYVYLTIMCCAVVSHFSCVRLFVTPWTVAHPAPLSMGIIQARILEWVAFALSRGSSQPRD